MLFSYGIIVFSLFKPNTVDLAICDLRLQRSLSTVSASWLGLNTNYMCPCPVFLKITQLPLPADWRWPRSQGEVCQTIHSLVYLLLLAVSDCRCPLVQRQQLMVAWWGFLGVKSTCTLKILNNLMINFLLFLSLDHWMPGRKTIWWRESFAPRHVPKGHAVAWEEDAL